jgi:hypothetical protein
MHIVIFNFGVFKHERDGLDLHQSGGGTGERMLTFLLQICMGKDHLEDLDLDGKILIKPIVKK